MIPPEFNRVISGLLVRLDEHHRPTAVRAKAIQELAASIGQLSGIDGEDLARLSVVALLHDIGKLDTPPGMLDWGGELDFKQRAVVEQHALSGARYVAALASWLGPWTAVLEHHHDSWSDLQGAGLASNVANGTGIVCVASAYVAMISPRAYAPVLSRQDALTELTNSSTFNPAFVAVLAGLYTSKNHVRVLPTIESSGVASIGRLIAKLVGAAVAVALLATGANALVGGDSREQALATNQVVVTTNTTTTVPGLANIPVRHRPTVPAVLDTTTTVVADTTPQPPPPPITPAAPAATSVEPTVTTPRPAPPRPAPPRPAPPTPAPPTPAPPTTPPVTTTAPPITTPHPAPPTPAPPTIPPATTTTTTRPPDYEVYTIQPISAPYSIAYSYAVPRHISTDTMLQWMATANCEPTYYSWPDWTAGRRLAIPFHAGVACRRNY